MGAQANVVGVGDADDSILAETTIGLYMRGNLSTERTLISIPCAISSERVSSNSSLSNAPRLLQTTLGRMPKMFLRLQPCGLIFRCESR